MENSITTTGGGQAQLPMSLTNTPMLVALLGSQNLPESTTIRIYEISSFNSGGTSVATQTTTARLQLISENEEHHPTSELVALLGSQNMPESTTIRIYEISSIDSGGTTVVTQTATARLQLISENEEHHPTSEFESSNSQDDQRVMTTSSTEHSDQSGTIGVSDGEITNLTLTKNVLPDIENQIESTTRSMENLENGSNNHPPIAPIATVPHFALLDDYSNPKIATYFVGVYPTTTTLLSFKFVTQKYSPFDTHIPCMIISIVAYLMAILDLAILFRLYDRVKRLSNQHFSPGHYKILTYLFHILWILAMVLVVPTVFTSQR